MIPYLDSYTLIGTTDVPVSDAPDVPQASTEEIEYLCRAVNRYLLRPVTSADIAWSYAGVRPLYDDGSANPSAVTRDYTLRLDDDAGSAPVLSVFGGKITTYRRLAEHALEKLAPWFPNMKEAWTDTTPLPGGEAVAANSIPAAPNWQSLPANLLDALRNRHGARVAHLLFDVKSVGDLGVDFGANLYAREVDYMIAHEWAQSGEDVLYRRSKTGLNMTAAQRAAVEDYVAQRLRAR
jgi:glycerol-3-phosphate dehydrogenase